jgi:hypothetical protein
LPERHRRVAGRGRHRGTVHLSGKHSGPSLSALFPC